MTYALYYNRPKGQGDRIMTLQDFALSLCACQLKIEVIANRHHMSFTNDEELWNAVKSDKALANTKVVYFTIESDCLNIRIF